MPDAENIIVVAACNGAGVEPETDDALAFAGRLQALTDCCVGVWLLGDNVDAAARQIAGDSGFNVTAMHCSGLSTYVCDAYGSILAPALGAAAPAYVVAAHTSRGGEWAPGVAARIHAGCICGVDDLGLENGRIWFAKDRYGGKLKGRYASSTPTTLLTVQPGRFSSPGRGELESAGKVTRHAVTWRPGAVRFEGTSPPASGDSNLKEARIVVAVGNGIGDEKNLEWIERLARRLPNTAVAGTRIVCDRGWLGYDRQVGVTGTTVMPALYVACGISGASQHLVGMLGSGYVIAVNTDAYAPIFSEADVCIVADITEFIPAVLEALEKTEGDILGG